MTDSVAGRPQPDGEAPPAVAVSAVAVPAVAAQSRPAHPVTEAAPPPARGRGRWRRREGSALTVVLLVAVGVVVFLRLHHPALQVTGVAITSQVKDGCSVDVTGRISTVGGAGTVSYQWILTPATSAPGPLSQSVTAGQSTIYVNATLRSTGQFSRQVTLQVLGPGQGRATANVDANC
jgi:hypothetical protein